MTWFFRLALIANKMFNYIFYCCLHDNIVLLNAWVHVSFGKIVKRNLGDELNCFLLSELTGYKFVPIYDLPKLKGKTNYLCIGSLVEDFTTPNTIIWGSGALYGGSRPLRNKPKQICAVRGRLTREYLLNNGVDCPEVYGDPALLLPYVYKPIVERRYKYGIVPHVDDLSLHIVAELEKKGVHVIRLSEYDHWHDVVDEICMCESVLSSSLHGLIISDAYHVPNLWIKLSDNLLGGDFKFKDYFSAVHRESDIPLHITDKTSFDEIDDNLCAYRPIKFDPSPLIKSAPWKLKINY